MMSSSKGKNEGYKSASKMIERKQLLPTPPIDDDVFMQHLSRLMKIRDFVSLILSYPMRIGNEKYLEEWINEVSQFKAKYCEQMPLLTAADDDKKLGIDSLWREVEILLSKRPLRYVGGFIPQDIIRDITNDQKQVPQPILDLAICLAVRQLSTCFSNPHVQYVLLSTRNDAEKQVAVEKIKVAPWRRRRRRRMAYPRLLVLDVSKDEMDEKFEALGLEVRKWLQQIMGTKLQTKDDDVLLARETERDKHVVLVVNGDGEKKLDPYKARFPKRKDCADLVVFITTESSASQTDELNMEVDRRIRIEDHVLPWEIFCKNVGSELVHSSSSEIQRIAVQIVQDCGGHLLAILLVAKSLQNVEDVQLWKLALEKLHYPNLSYELSWNYDVKVLVNAFINIIWVDVIFERQKPLLTSCLNVFESQDLIMGDDQLFENWFSKQLINSQEEAEQTLRELVECSILLQFEDHNGQYILLPEEISDILNDIVYKDLKKGGLGLAEPPKVWNWHGAAEIELMHNNFSKLPQCPNCPRLKKLYLHGNVNVTEIPTLFFQHMPMLQVLDLSYTGIQGLPSSIFKLAELKMLYLRGCKQFKHLPPEIEQLQNLEKLYLDGTPITHLPPSLNFPRLEELYLHDNANLTEIPTLFFQHMPLLQVLDLSYIGIRGLPTSIFGLAQLKTLYLRGCKQFNQLLQEIEQLQNLEKLDLSGTPITHLPPSLSFPKLRSILFEGNLDLMEIPVSFFDHMPLLNILNLSCTSILDLPSSFFKLEELRVFFLKDCELFMELPPEIGRLRNLKKLDLDGTQITHLPKEIQELTNLESLSISFSGYHHSEKCMPCSSCAMIPLGVISKLTHLEYLRIDVHPDNEWWNKNVKDILGEIVGFSKLLRLDFFFPHTKLLEYIPRHVSQFRFIVGHHVQRIISRAPPAIEVNFNMCKRCLRFINGVDFPNEVKNILPRAEAFFLDRHMTINHLSQFELKNVRMLQVCILAECNEMQNIVDGEDSYLYGLLYLEFLTIFYMKNLRSIIERSIPSRQSHCRLKFLALHTCPELTTILTMHFLHNLSNLEEIVVEDCPKVSSLVSCESLEPISGNFLPSLRRLSLLYLPNLVTISNGLHFGQNLERIGFYYYPKLESLSFKELSSRKLKVINGEIKWWEGLKWSEEEWGLEGRPYRFDKIFCPIDEQVDVLTQLTTYYAESSNSNEERDSVIVLSTPKDSLFVLLPSLTSDYKP
ncbi:Disease resistance protein [Senna tora]|uniref:Disease resistance protein n=1 Tax=Senna tora TaxID=362788 RepID=A0A835CIS7_9FABA|nr:Disease resistance protein [Senna tora]